MEELTPVTTYDWAIRLQQWGAQAALPVTPGTKAVTLKWTEYKTRQSDASELYEWFEVQGRGLAVLLGSSLAQVDFDTDDPDGGFSYFVQDHPEIARLPRVETGSGRIHCYFRPVTPFKAFNLPYRGGVIQFRTGNHIAVMPPTVHPDTGVFYEWVIPPTNGFPVLDLERVGIRAPERSLVALRQAPFEEGEPLDEAEIENIVLATAPFWQEGQRHDLALALSGWMAGHGIPEDSARTVVDRLAAGDLPLERRRAVSNVRDTYAKVEQGHPVAGWSVLVRDQLLDTEALDALDRLMDGRPVNQVEEAITNPDRPEMPYIVTLDEFLEMDLPEQSWLVKGMLLEASVNLLIGPPKTFKTFFELERHFAIATGSECFGIFPTGEPRKTCYVQRELESSAWQGRLRRMVKGSGLQMTDVEDRMLLINGHKVRVDDVDDMRRFTDELLTKHPDLALVTFDTFRKSHGQDENDNNKMDELVMDVLLRIRDEFRIAIDLIHHTNKAREANSFEEQMRGAVVIWGSCDDGLWLQRIKDDGDEMIRKTKVSFHGRNIETTTPFGFRLVDTAGGGLAFETFPLGDTSDRRKQTHEKVLDWLDATAGWHDSAAVGKALGLGTGAAARAMQRLVEGGEVRDRRGDHNRKWVASKKLPLQDDLDF